MIDTYKQNIQHAQEIANELGIKIVLDCGSLLGYYRDGQPIKGDFDDIDFAVPYEIAEHKMLEIIKAFTDRGFELYRLRPTVITFMRGGNKVDFLFYKTAFSEYPVEAGVIMHYITLYHKKERYALLAHKEAYDNLQEIEYMGTTLNAPADIESHLEHRYGDWKEPILRPKFTFENYIERGVMIPL